jgi:hypothetical protein
VSSQRPASSGTDRSTRSHIRVVNHHSYR